MGAVIINNNIWKTSVNELLHIFEGALLAVIPWLEKAKINWKEGEAYDDWDNIVEAIYGNIVYASLECSPLYISSKGEVMCEYSIAKYNFHYEDYSSMDFIGVKCMNNPEKQYAFVAFQSNVTPFDSVKVAELDNKEKLLGYVSFKNENLEFSYIKRSDGIRKIIREIEVLL